LRVETGSGGLCDGLESVGQRALTRAASVDGKTHWL
jgi:hypothetical protein